MKDEALIECDYEYGHGRAVAEGSPVFMVAKSICCEWRTLCFATVRSQGADWVELCKA